MAFSPRFFILVLLFAGWSAEVGANNIQISNVRLTDRDVSAGVNNAANFTYVRFDLSWDNAWRLNYAIGMNNNDAAWVFLKYRQLEGSWQHAYLNNSGHDIGTYSGSGAGPAQIDIGLLDPTQAFDNATNPCLGVFISMASIIPEPGPFVATSIRLRWNYGAQGIPDDALLEIRLSALEMVYVPQGPFFVGNRGTARGAFTNGSWTSGPTVPLRITSEAGLTIGNASGNLWGRSSSGDSTIGSAGTLPAAFPKGYNGFYGMKYELTQEQWVDFFNMLNSETQRTNRDITGLNGKNTDALEVRNNVSWVSGQDAELPGDEYGDVPCNFLSWGDLAAYLDWAGLRPMTELEFEKACRGERDGLVNEYGWGTNDIAILQYSVSNPGASNSGISANYGSADIGGNGWYGLSRAFDGPVRVGIFAANAASTGRSTASSSRYGQMEMSGNLWERCVNVGTAAGRAYTGVHGDGALDAQGQADASNWPGLAADGVGFRGGGWNSVAGELRISDRSAAVADAAARTSLAGGRGARSIVCDVPVGSPGAIDTTLLFGNVWELQSSGAQVGEGYLWILPSDWRIISGQGTNRVFVTSASFPATIYVMFANGCGYGLSTTFTFPSP